MKERKKILESAKRNPIISIQHFAQAQFRRFGKSSSLSTIKRILKRGKLIWKRLRNSLKGDQDQTLFKYFQEEMIQLTQEAKVGVLDLCYFDETGLNLNPTVPYAWQEKGTTALLTARRNGGITLLGVLNPISNKLTINIYEGAANVQCVIQTIDEFSLSITKKMILILDNASIHKAKAVKEQEKKWRQRGVLLQFIPAYSPELNLIEIPWKRLKHSWFKPQYYVSMNTLIAAADYILLNFGRKYYINFYA